MIQLKPSPKTALYSSELNLTYEELCCRIHNKKMLLSDKGWENCRVAIDLPDSYTLIEWTAANWQQGNHILLLDQRMKQEEKKTRLNLFSPDLIISYENSASTPVISFFQAEVPFHMSAEYRNNVNHDHRVSDYMNEDKSDPDPTKALTLFSSGSTGTPKSISRTYQSLLDEWTWYTREAGSPQETSRVLCLVPLSHTLGMISAVMHTLLQGGAVAFPDFIKGEEMVAAIERYHVSHVYGVAFHYKLMADKMGRINPQRRDKLRKDFYMVSSGGPLPVEIYNTYLERYGLLIGQQYGMSEVGYISVDFTGNHPNTLGKIAPHIHYEWTEEQAQLAIRLNDSPYSGKEDNWVTDPEGDGSSGILYTQDVVHINEHGYVKWTGRSNDQISIGGHKVTLQEIEAALNKHPLIKESAAVHYVHPVFEHMIEAFIVWEDQAHVEPLDVISLWIRNHLSDYKIPKKLHVIKQLPISAAGKLLRGELLKELVHGTHH